MVRTILLKAGICPAGYILNDKGASDYDPFNTTFGKKLFVCPIKKIIFDR
jgi:hypothetical protein